MSRFSRGSARRQRQAGFNLVEVMVAMVILVVAVIGAAKLQYATTRANISTRNRMHMGEILQTWLERVKMDAMAWEAPAEVPSLFEGETDGAWFHIPDSDLQNDDDDYVGLMAANYFGDEVEDDPANDIRYCVSLRRELLRDGVMRADVLVWRSREGRESATSAVTGQVEVETPVFATCDREALGFDPCPDPPADPDPHFYCMQASTLVARN